MPARIFSGPIDFASLQRIAVFRALQLGDLLCLVPALRALRAASPRARITLIGLPWAADFAQRYRCYVDDFVPFPGMAGLPEAAPELAALPDFLAQARQRQFDLALQCHGSGSLTNPLVASFGARVNAGFRPAADCSGNGSHFLPWADQEHEIRRYLRLLEFLGAEAADSELDFPLHAEDDADWHAATMATPALMAPDIVCIHPGARLPSRRWPVARFAEVADALADSGMRIVLTGSADERALTDAVAAAMRAPALNLAGRTSLGALAVLLARARLLVCNDTGVSHLAAAVGAPSVVICSGGDPHRWAPLDRQRHHMLHADVACRPCAHVTCPIGHPCATQVSVAAVTAQALAVCRQEHLLAQAEGGYRWGLPEPAGCRAADGHRRSKLGRVVTLRSMQP